jgi:translation initiation factor IF-2
MGHVDHGKTSLLDRIRSTAVAAKEAGGITQHIGAYSVQMPEDRTITFIDTPGHAAFTSMRARGADVTDIVILVVAADDGVMPQTREAINHAKAAKVPIIVAINKMDRPDANPDRVKSQLAELGLQPEDWGGDTMFFPISALKGEGIDKLLEGVLVLADVQELKANPDRRAKGTIIESRQDRGRGVVATVLVQAGTLRVGDIFVSGAEFGRVRTMTDYKGQRLEIAGPSTPVEITGLNGMPASGDDLLVMESESDAREVAGNRAQTKEQQQRALATGPISLEEFAKRAGTQAAAELNVILKADVQGSVEAVKHSIEKLSGEKVKVRVLHSAVGGINESDVQLAVASKAIIVGFGVRGEPRAMADAEQYGIQVRFYRVIYELLDDVKNAMVGLLAPIKQESSLGRVEVRDTFTIPKIGTIAGCYVTGGTIRRNAFARLLRDNRVIHEGKMSSLRRFKDDVKEVQAGFECGIGLENFNDVKIGDVIDVYEIKEIAPTLE